MCDEYDDERMRAFWRAIAAMQVGESHEDLRDEESPLVHSVVAESAGDTKRRPRALTR